MKKSQFEEYSRLMKRKDTLNDQLNYMQEKAHSNTHSKDIPIHEMGWLKLSYGNGSWSNTVLNNRENVKEISKTIIEMLEKELNEVKTKMELI